MKRNKVNSICIITSPFGCIPPHAIGAVEKRWKSCGDYYNENGVKTLFVCKRPEGEWRNDDTHIYLPGYGRTGSWLKDFLLDLVYSWRALRCAPKSDALVMNTIWTPILLPLFKHKFKVTLYNVARFPKKQFGFYKAADVLSCVSTAVYNCLIKQTPSSKRQACVISNFINTQVFSKKREHRLSEHPCVVYSGRVHREKGLELLVQAVNALQGEKRLRLKIIGSWKTEDGGSGEAYRSELNALAKGWDIEWIEPIYQPEKLAEEMDKGDIYCYPSKADLGETFGVAPLEAMGLGLPVIVSALDCFKDFLHHEDNGLVFDHRSTNAVEQLTQCLRLLLNDASLYDKYSRRGMEEAMSFNIKAKADEYLTVLNNVLQNKRTGFDPDTMRVKQIQ